MKKIICMVSVVIATLIAPAMLRAEQWSVPESTPSQVFASGSGTESNPYIIKTAQQLANFAYMVYWCYDYYEGKYIALDSDIALGDEPEPGTTIKRPWMPIGSEGTSKDGKFYGTFDGRGHTISGLYIDASSTISGYVGLFGTVKGNGVVKNVHLKNAYIDLGYFDKHNLYVGGIVGYTADNAQVTGCSFEGSIIGFNRSQYQGGIVGYHNSYTDITDCQVSGYVGYYTTVGGKASSNSPYVGGIAGYSYSTISNCNFRGIVCGSEELKESYVGGIVGYCKKNVVNCSAYGTDSNGNTKKTVSRGAYYAGGIAGLADVVSHCLNYADVACSKSNTRTGGIAGMANTVEYSANFGRVYSTYGEPIALREGMVGGIVGEAYRVKSCVNYGYTEFPDVTGTGDNVVKYGGIAGQCHYSIKTSLNMGRLKYAQLDNQGTKINVTYGVCGSEAFTTSSTYYEYTFWPDPDGGVTQATPSGNEYIVVPLTYVQDVKYLNTMGQEWGLEWGLEPTTTYPMPMLWGGQEREYVLMGANGDGSEENPYIVANVDDYNKLNNALKGSDGMVGKYVRQVGDLDFKGHEFMPLGMYYDEATKTYTTQSFNGHYDGGGHTVRNVEYCHNGWESVGFIGTMYDGGSLSNINFENVNFTIQGEGYAGIAVGYYNTVNKDTYTPLSGVNVLGCSVKGYTGSIIGGLAGRLSTQININDIPLVTPNLNIMGCSVHYTTVESSNVAGGMVGIAGYVNIDKSTVTSRVKVNDSTGTCSLGGLIGCVGKGFDLYAPLLIVNRCVVQPTFDYFVQAVAGKIFSIGGVIGANDNLSPIYPLIMNTLIDYDSSIAFEGSTSVAGTIVGEGGDESTSTTLKLKYVQTKGTGKLIGAHGVLDGETAEWKNFEDLGGWSAYYLNGNSNQGDMKWGYYYPTASPNSYAVTSANGLYTHYNLANASQITAPEMLYVDFTLPTVPLDNNVLTAAEGTSISQALVAAKANLVSQNGVASRLYLHDKKDFTYPGSFETYTVHYQTSYGDPQWQVLCLPFEVRSDMLPEGSEMYAIGRYTGSKAVRKAISVAEAGEPFILCHDGVLEIDSDDYNGTVTGTATAGEYLAGTFATTQAAAGDYVLSDDGKNFVRLTKATSVVPFRGYAPAASFPGGGEMVPVTDDATAVDGVAAERTVISGTEGAVVIEGADGVARIYTAGGAVVKQEAVSGSARVTLAPGFYIVEIAGNKAKVTVK